LTPACAGLVEHWRSVHGLRKPTFNSKKISCASCPDLSSAILAQFTLGMCVAARNRKKITKNPYFEVLRSLKVIDVDISKKLVASTACLCLSATIFYARRANSGKITSFQWRCPTFAPRSWKPPLPSGMKFCREVSYHTSKLSYPKSLFHLGLNWYQVVTDGQTDRITVANTRVKTRRNRL